MLRVLSSVGLTVSQFIHEIKYYMDNIQSDIRFLLQTLEGQHKALERVRILDTNFSSFHHYTAYFNDVVSANVIRDLVPLNIRSIVTKFVASMADDASQTGITFLPPHFTKHWLYTKAMHPSEWSSILFNFYTNSKKAIKRATVKGEILMECGESDGLIYLEFSDNGDGIKKEAEALVFDEFYTTTSIESLNKLGENTEVLGTGWG